MVKNFKGKYLILENRDGVKVSIDRQKALKIESKILKRYSIESSQRL